ncbi:hypothetical protein [Streptomyces sp. NRRL S-87]|uniref:hypothetical protein n=1 Tax=Streptomyces sp. NRRL S-87 TaxID=1463920 RepID=UPI0004BF292E|nr:hypothetical protein [Streptomyces sp. NRRL S-87]
MDTYADQQLPHPAHPYAQAQLARAATTARTHADETVRRRAAERVGQWREVLAGTADGRLVIGSRTPVAGLPAWVTPEVVRGGFATGAPSAGGPLLPYEEAYAREAGVPATRADLFGHALTRPGLDRLWDLLDSGRYEVALPEEAALLTVAWLLRAGDADAALELVGVLAPFADRLRFTPRPAGAPVHDPTAVHRRTVAEVSGTLARRRPHAGVEAQREALTVWQPFGDALLAHWLDTAPAGGRVLDRTPDRAWYERGGALLRRYRELAAAHPHCGKHRNPKENLGILRGALEEVVARRPLEPRRLGMLRHAAESMVRRRGLPGSAPHTALRARQAAQAALPSHHAVAQLVLRRLSGLPQDAGLVDTGAPVAPVTPAEEAVTGLPTGTEVPDALRRVVAAALSAPVGTLVERGVVPSAEVLAELVPQLVAVTTAEAYPDPALRVLMAATYRAFRNRRSLLLLNLQGQVRIEELPWVRAAAGHRAGADRSGAARSGAYGDAVDGTSGGRAPGAAGAAVGHAARDASAADAVPTRAEAVLRQLGELAVQGFPATLLPNPLVRELGVLARQAELGAPLVEELAADIFEGTFGPKFLAAARIAAELLGGTVYERYYGIDYAAVRNLAVAEAAEASLSRYGVRTSPGFARLCHERAAASRVSGVGVSGVSGASGSSGTSGASWPVRSVAANGMVIEQAQILTTHNLAVLVARAGIAPQPGWADLAFRCFTAVCRLTARVHGNPWPLTTVKDAAYAWRHMVFHLSLCGAEERADVLARLEAEAARQPAHVGARLAPALAGLRWAAAGGRFEPDGTADGGRARRLLGWTTGRHWLRADPFADNS